MKRVNFNRNAIRSATRYLVAEELAFLNSLNNKFKDRQTEWLTGRIAAKQAVRECLHKLGHHNVPYTRIIISTALGKRPHFDLLGKTPVSPKQFHLAISHSAKSKTEGLAVAEVSHEKLGLLGVDVQAVRSFPKKVCAQFLTKKEQAWLEESPPKRKDFYTTLLWSTKEAYLKAIGLGLRLKPNHIELTYWPKYRSFSLRHNNVDVKINLWYNIITSGYILVKILIPKQKRNARSRR